MFEMRGSIFSWFTIYTRMIFSFFSALQFEEKTGISTPFLFHKIENPVVSDDFFKQVALSKSISNFLIMKNENNLLVEFFKAVKTLKDK